MSTTVPVTRTYPGWQKDKNLNLRCALMNLSGGKPFNCPRTNVDAVRLATATAQSLQCSCLHVLPLDNVLSVKL